MRHPYVRRFMFSISATGFRTTPSFMKAKVRFALERQTVEVIGFYSNRHRGIFTPGDANVHMHIKSADGRMSGHLENIHLDRGATLAVPRVEGNP